MFTADDASTWTPGLNPEFVARVHAKRREERRNARTQELRRIRAENERQRVNEAKAALAINAKLQAEDLEKQRERIENMSASAKALLRAKADGLKTVNQIIAETAFEHNGTVEEIVGPSQIKRICAMRHIAMVRAYIERPDLSLKRIGMYFNRDHTSVFNAVKKSGVWRNPGRTYENRSV